MLNLKLRVLLSLCKIIYIFYPKSEGPPLNGNLDDEIREAQDIPLLDDDVQVQGNIGNIPIEEQNDASEGNDDSNDDMDQVVPTPE